MRLLFQADLHIHSVLSPCAEREMLPPLIILEALTKKIDMIAVTDHNTSDNTAVTVALGERFGVWVVPGMEVETGEEIHCLCYFPDLTALRGFSWEVERHLPRFPLDESIWGEEWVVGEDGTILEKKDHLLTRSLTLSIEEVFCRVERFGGIPIPAHIDQPSYSIIQVLGFIPPDLKVPALEVSRRMDTGTAGSRFSLRGVSLLRSSDAHCLADIGCVTTTFSMNRLSWDEFRLALSGQEGRFIQA
ncbi:MAG TPA: hypothetical protein VLH40_04230 [Atribacteraceae bacterium]|nr:hypothetical protein [Atribacteraceae bacterium]